MLHAAKRPTADAHPMEAARIRLEEAFLRLEQASKKRAEREGMRAGGAKELDIQRLEKECRALKDDKGKLNHLLKAAEATRESSAQATQRATQMLDQSIRKLQTIIT